MEQPSSGRRQPRGQGLAVENFFIMITLALAVVIVAVVPCLLAADGFLSILFSSQRPSINREEFGFSDDALPTMSGYLTVNERSQARMFYAFYEALHPQKALNDTPIILWLQGGPGCSGMTGNFYELGPWTISEDLKLNRNEYPWNNQFGVLFVDNPVGTGFSIAEKDEDIPTDQEQVATHLYRAMTSFFELKPSFGVRPFFIAGESYAGKYVPSLGHYIAKQMGLLDPLPTRLLEDETMTERIEQRHPFRLDGLVIGNGLTDPETQVQTHADTAYNFGLIDKSQKVYVQELAQVAVGLVKSEEWEKATKARTEVLDWIINASGIATPLDVRRKVAYHCGSDGVDFLHLFLNQTAVKAALNAESGTNWVSCNPRVRKIMSVDVMKSTKWMVDGLLAKFPMLLFQGQYDIKDGVASSEEWMRTLSWQGTEAFFSSERKIWRVGRAVAGYWRTSGNLTHVAVLGAGHMVAADQALHAQQMIEKWIWSQLDP